MAEEGEEVLTRGVVAADRHNTPVHAPRGPGVYMNETHTSDLTANCLRSVQLRHEGKRIPDVATAIYRGQLFHECAATIHRTDDWLVSGKSMANKCAPVVGAGLLAEGRTMTAAVKKNQPEIIAEVAELIDLYTGRFASYFANCDLIGVEVPVRATIGFVNFASHIDLLFRERDVEPSLCLWDWKTGDAPTWDFLARGLQLPCYHEAVRTGDCFIKTPGFDDAWIPYHEAPRCAWVVVDYLLPFGKKGTHKDDDTNEDVEHVKGDARPTNAIVKWLPPVDADAVAAELTTRQTMMDQGLWPTNPDPIGCKLCESRRWCPSLFRQEASVGTQ